MYSMLQIVKNASQNLAKTAIFSDGETFSYENLLNKSAQIATKLLSGEADLNQKRVAFMVSPGFEYVAFQWGIWRAGGVAVPLCITYPLPSLKYVIEDTAAEIVIAGPEYLDILKPLVHGKTFTFYNISDFSSTDVGQLPDISSDRNAMILYTSGTSYNSCQSGSSNKYFGGCLAMDFCRPYRLRVAVAPCTWYCQCHFLCFVVGCYGGVFGWF
jgi:malonyl-CoA/methylmalonyl-CoA synthetase